MVAAGSETKTGSGASYPGLTRKFFILHTSSFILAFPHASDRYFDWDKFKRAIGPGGDGRPRHVARALGRVRRLAGRDLALVYLERTEGPRFARAKSPFRGPNTCRESAGAFLPGWGRLGLRQKSGLAVHYRYLRPPNRGGSAAGHASFDAQGGASPARGRRRGKVRPSGPSGPTPRPALRLTLSSGTPGSKIKAGWIADSVNRRRTAEQEPREPATVDSWEPAPMAGESCWSQPSAICCTRRWTSRRRNGSSWPRSSTRM